MRRPALVLAAALALGAGCAPAERSASPAGAGGTLIVGNKSEDSLSFVDLARGEELGRAQTGQAPHEVAVSPDGRQAAVVAYGGRTIDIFDIASRTRLRSIDLSPNEGPHGLVWLADGRLVATTERSRSLTLVDTRDGDKVSAVATDQAGTHMVAVSPDARTAYTANIGSGTVSAIDLAGRRKLRDVAVGGRPEAIALSPDGGTLWVGDLAGARVQAFDAKSFAKLAELPTGAVPIRLVATPDGKYVIASNAGAGTLTVIDARKRAVDRTITVSGSAEAAQVTIILSSDGKRLYAAETGRDRVAEIDLASGRVLRRFQVGRAGDGLAIAP